MLKAAKPGILPVKALFDAVGEGSHATYEPFKWGLQYFGKYSKTRSAKTNLKKQMKTIAQGPASSPELLGMMYWTLTTGLNPFLLGESIERRDKRMWTSGQQALTRAWKVGVKDHIIARAGHQYDQWHATGFPVAAVGRSAKSFMPNIVMMDFADPSRCATIWNLNFATADNMARMADDLLNLGNIL